MVDETKLHQFVGQMLSDLGGAASVALVRIGDALGLYKTMHERGPMTVAEMAASTGVNQRYLREWLSHQAASNYVSYDPATQKFTLPEESRRWFLPSQTVWFSCPAPLAAWPRYSTTRQKSSRHSRPGPASPGAIRRAAFSAPSPGSFARATTTI